MTKRLNSKHKVDRRLKVNLWGRPKSPFNTRAYGPGQHGQTRSSKPSDYGIQLQAKQKLKAYYGNINERQFRNIYKKAVMLKGDTGENLIGLLERRLDAVIYRAKFATTIFSARQLINHGHVKVNGKKVNIGSYLVKEEDSIEIRDKSKQLAIVDIALANKERETPEYIQMDEKNKKLKAYYGNINERQFRNIYKKASMLKGDTSENLIGLLERRLDAVIYRAKFATTIFSARQLINHGHVKVNGKKVNISSYSVKEEDSIEIRDKSKQLAIIDIALASKERDTPEYIQLDQKNKKFKFVRIPKFEEVPYPIVMEPNLVIEYYSR